MCSSLLKNGESKKFECTAENFMILPAEQGKMRIDDVKLTLTTTNKSYKSMEIKMSGDKVVKVRILVSFQNIYFQEHT